MVTTHLIPIPLAPTMGATCPTIEYCGELHASELINPQSWAHNNNSNNTTKVWAILLYGSWNTQIANSTGYSSPLWVTYLNETLKKNVHDGFTINQCITAADIKVDADDKSVDICVDTLMVTSDLPALIFITPSPTATATATATTITNERRHDGGFRVEHVDFSGRALEALLTTSELKGNPKLLDLISSINDAWERLFDIRGNILPSKPKVSRNISSRVVVPRRSNEPAIRLFIAGDRSQVGKSSICLGLIGALLKSGKYTPADIAYIKPATQCEQTQLVEEYCKHKGITACVPIGPIVYYKGFTRAFLKGETGESPEQMLQKASDAVDTLAMNKRVVIIDGVGYPSVGSITGTDNASVARVCGRTFTVVPNSNAKEQRSPAPVLLIGKTGVGDAVDSFNINATYFIHKNVPVIGAIFNKLSLDGFYSLSNCKEAIDMYFSRSQPDKVAFGYIPEIPSLKNAREHVSSDAASKDDQLKQTLNMAEMFVQEFIKHVNVDSIMTAAKAATNKYISEQTVASNSGSKRPADEIEGSSIPDNTAASAKVPRIASSSEDKTNGSMMNGNVFSLTREQIEALASNAGAAGG